MFILLAHFVEGSRSDSWDLFSFPSLWDRLGGLMKMRSMMEKTCCCSYDTSHHLTGRAFEVHLTEERSIRSRKIFQRQNYRASHLTLCCTSGLATWRDDDEYRYCITCGLRFAYVHLSQCDGAQQQGVSSEQEQQQRLRCKPGTRFCPPLVNKRRRRRGARGHFLLVG